jgi:two-component system cell cycle response regulator
VRPRVLIVDDSDVARTMLARTLSRAGFEVLEARDGAEGVLTALREAPAVVVTDLEMPVMDGYQLLRLLKADPAARHMRFVIMTSHDEAPSRFWGLHTGADVYLLKGEAGATLVRTVEELTEDQPEGGVELPVPALQGPQDVLARVAQQLDASLLRATLARVLLEGGMQAETLHGACQAALAALEQVVDASVLGLGVAEAEAVTIHLQLGRSLSLTAIDRFSSDLLARLSVPCGATVDMVIDGEQDSSGEGVPEEVVFLELPLPHVQGLLALAPRDLPSYQEVSSPLVEGLLSHLALVLNNARLSQRLQELSTLDGLTRLLNHRSIHDRLVEEIGRALRYDHPLSIAICDLDHFKRVNDRHGHLAGDAALRATAQAMRFSLRIIDAIGRYGGEEFLLVLPETGLEAARLAVERIRRTLAARAIPLPDGATLRITGSMGVACLAELPGEASADALVSLADARLYAAKAAGRNCVRP